MKNTPMPISKMIIHVFALNDHLSLTWLTTLAGSTTVTTRTAINPMSTNQIGPSNMKSPHLKIPRQLLLCVVFGVGAAVGVLAGILGVTAVVAVAIGVGEDAVALGTTLGLADGVGVTG